MLNFKLVYNNRSKHIVEYVKKLEDDGHEISIFNEDEPHDKKNALSVKNYFAVVDLPFIGVFDDNKPVKGFYEINEHKVNECNEKNIDLWLKSYLNKN